MEDNLIDHENLAEAAQQDLPVRWTKIWYAWAATGAGLVAIVIIVFWPAIWPLIQPVAEPGSTIPVTSSTKETTIAETVITPRWDDMSEPAKYIGGAMIQDAEFQAGVDEIKPTSIGERLGHLTLSGFDIYEDQTHTIAAEYYAIKGIDPDCVIAVQYKDVAGYYSFFNSWFAFHTLGDMINRLDLLHHLQINHSVLHEYWSDSEKTNSRYWTDTYDLVDRQIVWNLLLATQKSFYLGQEKADAFRDLVLSHGTLVKTSTEPSTDMTEAGQTTNDVIELTSEAMTVTESTSAG